MLADVVEHQLRRDRRDLEHARVAEAPLDVVLARQAEAAVRLHAHVGQFPRSVGGQHLRDVGVGAARLVAVELLGRPPAQRVGGLEVGIVLKTRMRRPRDLFSIALD